MARKKKQDAAPVVVVQDGEVSRGDVGAIDSVAQVVDNRSEDAGVPRDTGAPGDAGPEPRIWWSGDGTFGISPNRPHVVDELRTNVVLDGPPAFTWEPATAPFKISRLRPEGCVDMGPAQACEVVADWVGPQTSKGSATLKATATAGGKTIEATMTVTWTPLR